MRKIIIAGLFAAMLIISNIPAYAMTLEEYDIYVEQSKENGNAYLVSPNGGGSFTTIKEAVDTVQSGDTIFIAPGVYNEAISIKDKEINIIGLDRDMCIIEYTGEHYKEVPLDIAAGKVANLTIYSKKSGELTQEKFCAYQSIRIEDRSTINTELMPGYAIHIENDFLYGRSLSFENCKIVSDENYCVGMGCRGNSNVTFENCELIAKDKAGCIYMHNTDNELMAGDTGITFKNCIMKNYRSPYVMTVHSLGNTNRLFLTFQNVKVSTVAFEMEAIYNDHNLYTGLNVDVLNTLEKFGIRDFSGYVTSMSGNVVHNYDMQSSIEYMLNSPIENDVDILEGITYILMPESQRDINEQILKNTPPGKKRIRSVISVYNDGGLVGDGWCGLDSIYLTPDSFGNTLGEMNIN